MYTVYRYTFRVCSWVSPYIKSNECTGGKAAGTVVASAGSHRP